MSLCIVLLWTFFISHSQHIKTRRKRTTTDTNYGYLWNGDDGIDNNDDEDVSCFFSLHLIWTFFLRSHRFHWVVQFELHGSQQSDLLHIHISTTFRSHTAESLSNNHIININKNVTVCTYLSLDVSVSKILFDSQMYNFEWISIVCGDENKTNKITIKKIHQTLYTVSFGYDKLHFFRILERDKMSCALT